MDLYNDTSSSAECVCAPLMVARAEWDAWPGPYMRHRPLRFPRERLSLLTKETVRSFVDEAGLWPAENVEYTYECKSCGAQYSETERYEPEFSRGIMVQVWDHWSCTKPGDWGSDVHQAWGSPVLPHADGQLQVQHGCAGPTDVAGQGKAPAEESISSRIARQRQERSKARTVVEPSWRTFDVDGKKLPK